MNHNFVYKSLITSFALLCTLGCTSAATKVSDSTETKEAASKTVEPTSTPRPTSTPKPTPTPTPTPTPVPTCDGTTVTTGCQVDGVMYSTYIYHPAVPEQSHVETNTSTEQVVSGYCTLCKDGSYSPTCATGRGACSHHGGVAQKNAPVYSNQTQTTQTTVIDQEAVDEYYEKVEQ